ncbi:hypothetical protein CGZ88_1507 [Bifidobacterium anseris]|uniref:Uncharacterized protein n=1 Tax=Bifidobacterium anseris TaxID=2020963 RepID=A0A2N5IYI1_9BIFI|nr:MULTISPECIES: hypothetical protein [Bifidobacterium]PLS27022.1 hypothetical protein CGZ88_1507 [Bifidobacterium anseris]
MTTAEVTTGMDTLEDRYRKLRLALVVFKEYAHLEAQRKAHGESLAPQQNYSDSHGERFENTAFIEAVKENCGIDLQLGWEQLTPDVTLNMHFVGQFTAINTTRSTYINVNATWINILASFNDDKTEVTGFQACAAPKEDADNYADYVSTIKLYPLNDKDYASIKDLGIDKDELDNPDTMPALQNLYHRLIDIYNFFQAGEQHDGLN